MYSTECTSNCLNGGVCLSYLQQPSSNDDLTASVQGIEEKDHQVCLCPYGWVGGTCAVSNSNLHQCYSSGDLHLCRLSGEACYQDNESKKWNCICEIADSVNAFAGSMCRTSATEFCDESRISFCANGGSCKKNIFNLNVIGR